MLGINRSLIAAARVCGFVILAGTLFGAALPSFADSANREARLDVPPIVNAGPGVDAERVRARFEERVKRSQSSREQLYWRLSAATRGSGQLDFLVDAGNWLLTQQQPSGGFPFTAGETSTPPNVQAPIIAGLLRAWRRTMNSTFLDAAEQAGLYLRDNQRRFTSGNNSRRFSGADAFVFGELSRALGDPQFRDLADDEFWAPLEAGTYGPDGDWGIDEFIQAEFDRRANIEEVVAWDLAWAAMAAFEAGKTAFLDAIITGIETSLEFNTIDGGRTFDLVGLSGAVWAGARTGLAIDPQTGLFAAADSTVDLAIELLQFQDPDTGGFYFNTTLAMSPDDPTGLDTQVTAFAMLGLDLLDGEGFGAEITNASQFLVGQQQPSGQILLYPGADPQGGGGVETHAESMAGFATAALRPDVIRSVAETGDLPSATDNDYTRINNAIQTALADDVLELQGTFDWSEPNAIASWDAGEWWSLWPQGVNRVTIRPSSPGAATISGPGDLPQFDLEGVFGAVGENTGWEVSGLRFENIDNAIGMFFFGGGFSPPGRNQFDDTRIVDNHIVMPHDLDAPGEALQNIAIHYSRGENQLIAGNIIEIPGDGVSDPNTAQVSKNVGIQSNSGPNAFEGLVIENNVVRVMNAPSAEPAEIIGIWENAGASSGDLQVRGNVFENLDPANDPAVNLQEGFRIHSQVTRWAGNSVSGARYGIRWLPDDEFGLDFSGRPPVPVMSNFIRNNATGVSIESNGAGDFKCNVITGNTIGIVNNTAANRASDATINWWGCNAGPGNADCDDVSDASVASNNWLIATLQATPDTIPINQTAALEAALISTSEGGNSIFNGNCLVPDGLAVDFNGGALGDISPTAATLTAGIAGATFTPTATGVANDVTAVVEPGQQVSTTITITEAPEIMITPATVDFGDHEIGSTSPALAVTIDNPGSVDATISSISSIAPPFFETGAGTCPTPPFALIPGTNCTLEYEFAPGMIGTQSDSVAIVSDAQSSPDSFVLLGRGIMPVVALDPMALDFGNVVVGQTSPAQTVTLTNNGTTEVEIDSIGIGGAAAGDYALENNSCAAGSIVAPGLSCQFDVEFTPSAEGARSASVDLVSNAPTSPNVVPLDGVGVLAEADLSVVIEAVTAFGGVGQTFQYRVTVANAGPLDSDGAVVTTALDAGLTNITWTCIATGGATCPAAGSGELAETVDLPASGQAEFIIEADLVDGGADETITSSATVTPPADPPDPNPANNSDQVTARTGIFADGFES